jgi:hypothetical protein
MMNARVMRLLVAVTARASRRTWAWLRAAPAALTVPLPPCAAQVHAAHGSGVGGLSAELAAGGAPAVSQGLSSRAWVVHKVGRVDTHSADGSLSCAVPSDQHASMRSTADNCVRTRCAVRPGGERPCSWAWIRHRTHGPSKHHF